MIPTSFAESNHVIDKPADMTREQCDALAVFAGQTGEGLPVMISCWKLTKEELETVNKTGRVWLLVYVGGMPPVSLLVNTPFEPQPEPAA